MKTICQFFSLWFVLYVFYLRNVCPTQGHKGFSPIFSSSSFIVLGFIFSSMIHFKLIFHRFAPHHPIAPFSLTVRSSMFCSLDLLKLQTTFSSTQRDCQPVSGSCSTCPQCLKAAVSYSWPASLVVHGNVLVVKGNLVPFTPSWPAVEAVLIDFKVPISLELLPLSS